ncbi:helix-turn-helix domain-containing protein [Hyphococcus formosus]|uniref:helix-turn-helix transcriptional regulator n=1 Tax=Hyphococcus formosus TaxID=3143534 RepID=UPI00398B8CBE
MVLLTPKQAAQRLTLSPQTLARWRLIGQGPKWSKLGGRVVYEEGDLREWVKSQIRQSTSEVSNAA